MKWKADFTGGGRVSNQISKKHLCRPEMEQMTFDSVLINTRLKSDLGNQRDCPWPWQVEGCYNVVSSAIFGRNSTIKKPAAQLAASVLESNHVCTGWVGLVRICAKSFEVGLCVGNCKLAGDNYHTFTRGLVLHKYLKSESSSTLLVFSLVVIRNVMVLYDVGIFCIVALW